MTYLVFFLVGPKFGNDFLSVDIPTVMGFKDGVLQCIKLNSQKLWSVSVGFCLRYGTQ